MSKALLLILSLTSAMIGTAYCQLVTPNKFAVELPRTALLSRISFRVQEDLQTKDEATKLVYITSKFLQSTTNTLDSIVSFHTDAATSDANKIKTIQTDVKVNYALAKAYSSLSYRWTPTESFEAMETVYVTVRGEGFDGTTVESGGDPTSLPSVFVTTIDWKNIMYVIFSISKIIMNLAIIYITIFRPFMPIYARMRAAWVAQTIIYYQLLIYSGLLPGVFGYTIDMGQEGMLKSSRRYAFGPTAPKVDSEQEFVVYKYVQNDFIPKIFEEVHVEILCMMFIVLVCYILKAVHTRGVKEMRLFEIAKNVRSSVFLFSFVPFFVHYIHNIISLSYSKDHSAYSIIFVVIGTFKVVLYTNNFKKMAQGIAEINYLHSKGVY